MTQEDREMADEQRGDEVRLVAMKKSTCRELLNASEMWGGLLGNVPRNLLDHAWDAGITEEEANDTADWIDSQAERFDDNGLPDEANRADSISAKLRAAFNPDDKRASCCDGREPFPCAICGRRDPATHPDSGGHDA